MKTLKNILAGVFFSVTILACNSSTESKADQAYKDDKVAEAITLYEKAIAEGSETATNKLALLYDNEHQPAKAEALYIKSYNKGNKEATSYLANLSLKNENYADVIKYTKTQVDNGDTTLVYDLGSAYYKMKDYDNAVKYLLIGKNNVYTKDILGSAYYAKGDLKNAEIQWREAVDNFQSGAVNSYHKLLALYKEQNRMDDYNAYLGRYGD